MKLNQIALILVTCFACSTDDHTFASRSYSSVETGDATNITENGTTLHGEFLGIGTLPIKDYGFVYDQAYEGPRIGTAERVSLGTTVQTKFSGVADHALENGATCWYRTYAIGGDDNLVVYGPEKTFVAKGGLPPSISEIAPLSGKPNDVIVITGKGFSDVPYRASVTFGSTPAYVTKSASNSITCTVPILPVGDVDLVIRIGANGVPSSPKKFTITN